MPTPRCPIRGSVARMCRARPPRLSIALHGQTPPTSVRRTARTCTANCRRSAAMCATLASWSMRRFANLIVTRDDQEHRITCACPSPAGGRNASASRSVPLPSAENAWSRFGSVCGPANPGLLPSCAGDERPLVPRLAGHRRRGRLTHFVMVNSFPRATCDRKKSAAALWRSPAGQTRSKTN